jgi:AbrB family looped-hinge helix DNA binding protein
MCLANRGIDLRSNEEIGAAGASTADRIMAQAGLAPLCRLPICRFEESVKSEERAMTRVRLLRGGQVTLPAAMREQLQVKEGDYLQAEVVEGGMLLKPISAAEREKAWQRLLDAHKSVRYIGPDPRPSPEEEEEWLAEEIGAARREDPAGGRSSCGPCR